MTAGRKERGPHDERDPRDPRLDKDARDTRDVRRPTDPRDEQDNSVVVTPEAVAVQTKAVMRASNLVVAALTALTVFFGMIGYQVYQNKEKAEAACEASNETKDLIGDVVLEFGRVLGPGGVLTPEELAIYEKQFAPKLVHEVC